MMIGKGSLLKKKEEAEVMRKNKLQMLTSLICAAILGAAVFLVPCLAEESGETQQVADTEEGADSEENASSQNKYSVKEVGKISDSYGSIQEYRGALIGFRGSTYDLLNIHGETIVEDIAGAEKLFGNYVVATKKNADVEEKNLKGIFTVEGDEILSCQAASISLPETSVSTDYRYLKVIFVTEKTDKTDECILYFTDSMFSISPSPDDVMYKGYYKIFDVKNKKFVGDLEFTGHDSYSLKQCGDSFFVIEDGIYAQYDENGKVLNTGDEYSLNGVADNCFVFRDSDGNYVISDDQGRETFRSKQTIYTISRSDHGYLTIHDGNEDVEYVIDKNGNRVSDFAFSDSPSEEHNDVFTYRNDSNEYRIVKADGTLIAETIGYVTYEAPGYYLVETGLSEYALYGKEGVVAEGIKEDGYYLVHSNGEKLLVINKGDFLIPLNDDTPGSLFCGMARFYDGNAEIVYDVFNGEELLRCEDCRDTVTVGRYVLQQSRDKWTVSEVYFNDKPVDGSMMKD